MTCAAKFKHNNNITPTDETDIISIGVGEIIFFLTVSIFLVSFRSVYINENVVHNVKIRHLKCDSIVNNLDAGKIVRVM